jgi:hypothetical protein
MGGDTGILERDAEPGGHSLDAKDSNGGFPVFRLGAIEGVIVPATQMGEGYYWTPTEHELVVFESGLTKYLRKMKLKRSLLRTLPSFTREHLGNAVDGRRTLTALFFCRTPDGWGRRLIIVNDGGDCFFDVQYDPLRREYLSIVVHGDS